ncbi:MAG: hypothetical protein R3321_00440 [Nitrososphaeraceae archaeon]|nr:hypothetical protein [Nitrososphaeraceae archaeon]
MKEYKLIKQQAPLWYKKLENDDYSRFSIDGNVMLDIMDARKCVIGEIHNFTDKYIKIGKDSCLACSHFSRVFTRLSRDDIRKSGYKSTKKETLDLLEEHLKRGHYYE